MVPILSLAFSQSRATLSRLAPAGNNDATEAATAHEEPALKSLRYSTLPLRAGLR
jgi:hypothetical protein